MMSSWSFLGQRASAGQYCTASPELRTMSSWKRFISQWKWPKNPRVKSAVIGQKESANGVSSSYYPVSLKLANINMEMRESCEAPVQPTASVEEKSHQLYPKWVAYRSALSSQLVTAATFSSWLELNEREEMRKAGLLPYQIVDAHPRGQEYLAYRRSEGSANREPVELDEWLSMNPEKTKIDEIRH